jgi:hypothetical protein
MVSTIKPLIKFEEALKAADSYYKSAVNARDKQYEFLARAYIAFREGQKHKTVYAKMLELRLGREPAGLQKERPFLCLLRALMGEEELRARHSLPQYSKLAGALEAIHHQFDKDTPHHHKIMMHIKLHGGVTGLYERFLKNKGKDQQKSDTDKSATKPDFLSLPKFGITVRRSGRSYKVALPDVKKPGTYLARIQVGKNGVVEEWRLEEEIGSESVFKPAMKTG